MYAAAQTVGLLKSSNGGSTWAVVDTAAGFQNQTLLAVAVHPTDPTQVLLATSSNIWQSTNSGTSFSNVAAYSPVWMAYNPLVPSNVYASIADSQGGFLYSSTTGASWTIPDNIYIYPSQYVFHPTYSNVVFTAANQYTGASYTTVYVMWSILPAMAVGSKVLP